MRDLAEKLKFGKWRSQSPLHFTGVEVHIVSDTLAIRVVQEAYMQKVSPLTMDKSKKTPVGGTYTVPRIRKKN